jgi:hypothetical protein
MKVDMMIAKKEYAAAAKALEELPDPRMRQITSSMIARKVAMEKDPAVYPADFVKTIANNQEKMGNLKDPMGLVTLSILQWKAADKEASLKSAKSSVAAAQEPSARKLPVAPFEKFAKSVEDGTMPTLSEFYQWMSAETKAVQPVKPAAPAAPAEPAVK